MNNFKNRLEKMLIVICLIYMGLITISNSVVFIIYKVFLYAIPVILVIAILYIFVRFIKVKVLYFAVGIFILAFVLKALVAVCFNAPPSSDFLNFYNAALKAASGDFSFASDKYFSLWSYQSGIVGYYAVLIKMFGSGILALKMVNCLFIAGVSVYIYLIARKIVSEKHARLIALLYLFYPATFFLASVLTNQHVSNFLILSGVYMFINRQKMPIKGILFSAGFIALGNAMRPQAIVVILAIVGSLLFEIVTDIRDKKTNIKLIKTIFSFLLIYIIMNQGLSFGVKQIGLNDNGLKNTFPLYKFVVGLNDKTNGTYSQEDADQLTTIKNSKIRNEKAIRIIKERLANPKTVAILIIKKQVVMWAGMDISTEWEFGYLENTGLKILGINVAYDSFIDIIQKLEKAYYIVILLAAFYGILKGHRRYNDYNKLSIITLTIIINFVVYSLIEIQPRYRDFQMIFIFIIAAIGMELFEEIIITKIKSRHIQMSNKCG